MFWNQKENLSETLGISYEEEWNEILKIFNESTSQKEFKEKLKKMPNIILAAGVERIISEIINSVSPRLFYEYLPSVFQVIQLLIESIPDEYNLESQSQIVKFIAQFPKEYLIMLLWFFFSEIGKLEKLADLLPLKVK